MDIPIPLSIRSPPPVSTKIITLGDVTIRTILYAALVVGMSDHRTRKEIMPMSRTLAALASLVLTVVGVVFLYPECAYACSCPLPLGPERALSSSDAVFCGKVVNIEKPEGATRAPPRSPCESTKCGRSHRELPWR